MILREHELTSSDCKEMEQSYAQALEALKARGSAYRFSDVVEEFSNTVRIPQFFDRAVSEKEWVKGLELLGTEAQKISPDKRALAQQIVRGIADVLRNHWGDYLHQQMQELPKTRSGILLLLDLRRMFGDDYDAFINFFADGVAVNTEEETLRKSINWPAKLESILKLIEQANSAPQAEQEKVRSDLTDAVGNVLAHLGSGRELSLSMLQTLLLPLRPLLASQPGRPTKDYSREYERRASGLTWPQVTAQRLQENAELQEEFGGQEFESLTFEQRTNLTNRIREGVRSYAERTGKPFPIESPAALPSQDKPAENQ